MKKFILALFLLLFSVPSYAGVWCQWSGTAGINCQNDTRGFVRMPNGHRIGVSEENLNYHGFYERIDTVPSVAAHQVLDAVVWGFANNKITRTWTVRNLTSTELDERIASPMDITDYYLWKALLVTGTITQQQAANNLPQEMIDAYLARKRLLGD